MQQIVQMKIEQLIVQFLHKNKKVKLQTIGEFIFMSESSVVENEENSYYFPENSIQFKSNPRCTADEDLISYIMSQTGKIRPLAASDLDSYIVLSNQFLNIGKTLFLNGLGALQKNQNNEYEFTQGEAVAVKLDNSTSAIAERNPSDKLISFASPVRKKSPKRFLFPVIIAAISLVTIFIIIYFTKKEDKVQNNITNPVIDSTAYRDSLNAILNTNKIQNSPRNLKQNIQADTSLLINSDTLNSLEKIGHTDINDSLEQHRP